MDQIVKIITVFLLIASAYAAPSPALKIIPHHQANESALKFIDVNFK